MCHCFIVAYWKACHFIDGWMVEGRGEEGRGPFVVVAIQFAPYPCRPNSRLNTLKLLKHNISILGTPGKNRFCGFDFLHFNLFSDSNQKQLVVILVLTDSSHILLHTEWSNFDRESIRGTSSCSKTVLGNKFFTNLSLMATTIYFWVTLA